jgi:hypothetical protein
MADFDRWEDWQRKLTKIRLKQLRTIRINRTIFNQLRQAWLAQDQDELGDFAIWLRDAYVVFQGTWVRKMADSDSRSYSFAVLLADIANNACHICRERLRAMYAQDYAAADDVRRRFMVDHADQVFDKNVGVGAPAMTREMVEADLSAIRNAVAPVKEFVDRVVAHTDKRPTSQQCTFGELDAAVRLLEETFARYYILITGSKLPEEPRLEVSKDIAKVWPFAEATDQSDDQIGRSITSVISATT